MKEISSSSQHFMLKMEANLLYLGRFSHDEMSGFRFRFICLYSCSLWCDWWCHWKLTLRWNSSPVHSAPCCDIHYMYPKGHNHMNTHTLATHSSTIANISTWTLRPGVCPYIWWALNLLRLQYPTWMLHVTTHKICKFDLCTCVLNILCCNLKKNISHGKCNATVAQGIFKWLIMEPCDQTGCIIISIRVSVNSMYLFKVSDIGDYTHISKCHFETNGMLPKTTNNNILLLCDGCQDHI